MRRRPQAAVAAAAVLLLWLAVLTFAVHGPGRLLVVGYSGGLAARRTSVVYSLPRKMLLAVTTFDVAGASSSPPDHHHHGHHHHHHQHHHHQRDQQHSHHRHHVNRWNRQGIPPSAAAAGDGEGVDLRYGVQKRLVPTGPNPLHH